MHLNQISRRRSRWLPWLAAATAVSCLAAYPAAAASGTAAHPQAALDCGPPDYFIQCYSPQAYELAYGIAPLLSQGIDGRGETVVLPELAEPPSSMGVTYTDIRQDMAAFDSQFGLPAATLNVVNTIARSKTPYVTGTEEAEDTEMVHAIAPGATLDVVLVPNTAGSSAAAFASAITRVVDAAVALHAGVISFSASAGEHLLTSAEVAQVNAALERARQQHVTFVASSGDTGVISDDGPPRQVSLPASDPLVLAVGGTVLDARPAGTYLGEMAWNEGSVASAGGYSSLFSRPSYQAGVPRIGATRGVPDVAANADSSTAMAVALSGSSSLLPAEGTSAATPLWAGVIALADQEAGHPLGFVNTALYAIARGPAYHQAFHDVIAGDNSVIWPTGVFAGYTAGPGWDPVTGWGSPDAQYLVPLLAHVAYSGT